MSDSPSPPPAAPGGRAPAVRSVERPVDANVGSPEATAVDPVADEWRRLLTGTDPSLQKVRRWWRLIPSPPRCKVCAAPFHGPASLLTRIVMHGQSDASPLLCNLCFSGLRDHPGGAEVEISVLFADLRGSTGLAERTGPAEFRRLVQVFYGATTRVIDTHGGIVDKFLGDGVMALFIPFIAGDAHAVRAVGAARRIQHHLARSELAARGIGAGVGVHAGPAFVGVLGAEGKLDFTALGDTVNVAARLGSAARAGQVLVSATAWDTAQAASDTTDAGDLRDRFELPLTGREAPLETVVLEPTRRGA